MKTFLVIAAVLGLSSSAAFAECGDHQVTASAPVNHMDVDRDITTASIASPTAEIRSDDAAVLKRQPVEGQMEVAR